LVVIFRKGKNGQTFRNVVFQPIGKFGSALGILVDSLGQLGLSLGSVWRIEDSPDICRRVPLHGLARQILTGVLLQVKLATLPRDTAEHRFASGLQSLWA